MVRAVRDSPTSWFRILIVVIALGGLGGAAIVISIPGVSQLNLHHFGVEGDEVVKPMLIAIPLEVVPHFFGTWKRV